jgi:hypothetical protein
MTPIRFSPSSLKQGRWYEYVIRFALGGGATVFTGLLSSPRSGAHARSRRSSRAGAKRRSGTLEKR